jgi:CheY-like chemotaxis protein
LTPYTDEEASGEITSHIFGWDEALMIVEYSQRQIILVVEDIEETRDLIAKLLNGSGYCVDLARSEESAIQRAHYQSPDLILMSLDLDPRQLLAVAYRIRQQANLRRDVPIVIFCVPTIPEGAEIEVGDNIYMTRPDNFNQVRELIQRLLYNGAQC